MGGEEGAGYGRIFDRENTGGYLWVLEPVFRALIARSTSNMYHSRLSNPEIVHWKYCNWLGAYVRMP